MTAHRPPLPSMVDTHASFWLVSPNALRCRAVVPGHRPKVPIEQARMREESRPPTFLQASDPEGVGAPIGNRRDGFC